ncbi:immune inhibitor A [Colwellia sp. KU-HH00111]|uniref:immune inhibitor A domain-containing protein n=1 Tax=Colwellia sp. KU-HH00111 TaxID=3127652 RepID=UPI0031042A15
MLFLKKSIGLLVSTALLITTQNTAHSKQNHEHSTAVTNAPIKDAGVINKERIIYWLKKRGELAKDASKEEEITAFNRYIKQNKTQQNDYVFEIAGKQVVNYSKVKDKGLPKAKSKDAKGGNKNSNAHEVNILTLLIDFPDLPHDNNQLTTDDTAMFYQTYDADHYQNLMFSPTGFVGPNNENLMSAHQYYASESGESFKFNGKVYGWLTADKDASFYGENNEAGNDKEATSLIKEALNKAVTTYDIDLSEFDLIDPADLDGDGIIAEPDGYIDYIMVFHSSVGADAGGGVLGDDAIWAHRWNIDNYDIPNTDYNGTGNYRGHGYTVQGIDSAIGVVTHEFGHMVANLKDEYDTNDSAPNSPVGFWSLMSSGSWAGDAIPGAIPTGFSPLAKVELQDAFGGNWVTSTPVTIDELKDQERVIDIVAATTHNESTNLIDIKLPEGNSFAISPFAGLNQFHSAMGDNLSNSMSFKVAIPNSVDSKLSMKAFWDIEQDWDYAQVLVNGTPIKGNYTLTDNKASDTFEWYGLISNYITGKSSNIANGWLDLSFDVSDFKGQEITVSIHYSTDSNTGGYGLLVDDITLVSGDNTSIIDNAENANNAELDGFSRIEHFKTSSSATQNYYVQLRSYEDVDKGLDTEQYDHGILMWLADSSFFNNQVSIHPGQGFTSVIDADQQLVQDDVYGIWWTSNQIRDAVFSLFDQREKAADDRLTAISLFDDQNSYINPLQPESGVILPIHGLKMEVMEQAEDSSTAKIRLSAEKLPLTAQFSTQSIIKNTISFSDNSFGETQWLTYQWDFGDNSPLSFEKSATHTYDKNGEYIVELQITDNNGETASVEHRVATQGAKFTAEINYLEVIFSNESSWGDDTLSYLWDFGDGNQSEEMSPTHSYQSAGNYTIVLTASNQNGDTLTTQQTLTLKLVEPPESSFITTTNYLKVHGINKTVKGAGKLIYSWDFGDGSGKKAGTSPTHVYKSAGNFTITLLAKDALGRTSQYSQDISVTKAKEHHAGSIYWLLWLMVITYLRGSNLLSITRN